MGKVLHLLTGSEFEVEVRLGVEQWREGPGFRVGCLRESAAVKTFRETLRVN